MDADLFVEMLEKLACERAINIVLRNMVSPPGHEPDSGLVELSQWFNGLSAVDREMVGRAVAETSATAVFQCLCILDGAQAIEAGRDKGHLELFYVKNEARLLLNDRHKETLNDKFHFRLSDGD